MGLAPEVSRQNMVAVSRDRPQRFFKLQQQIIIIMTQTVTMMMLTELSGIQALEKR